MPFTTEERLELTEIMKGVLETDRIQYREKRIREAQEKPAPEPELITKLYLVSMVDKIGFPDEKGRVVLHQSVYALVTRKKTDWSDTFMTGDIEVIAFQDARLLETPSKVVIMGGIAAMVELPEDFLTKLQGK